MYLKKLKYVAIMISVFILFLLSQILNKLIDYEMAKTLFSSTIFLFGIYIAFSITNAYSRLNTIYETLNAHNADLLHIYNTSKVLRPGVHKKIQNLIELYLIDQIDYLLIDFKNSYNSFKKLCQYLLTVPINNDREKEIYNSYIDLCSDITHQRKEIEVLARTRMLFLDWVVIYLLSSIVIFFIYYLAGNTFFFLATSSILVIVMVVLIVLLDSLNDLSWKEQHRIWRPLQQLFLELNLIPYYPDDVIEEKRTYLKKGEKIRIVHYPNPYPNMKGKIVKIIVVK